MNDNEDFASLMQQHKVPLPQTEQAGAGNRVSTHGGVLPPFSERDDSSFNADNSFLGNGVSRKQMYRAFDRNEPDATIDLHGKTCKEAHPALDAFLTQALANHHRVVEVIHGRGLHSAEDRRARLRTHTRQWLKECTAVLAYQQPRNNSGSVLVWLRG